MIKNDVSYGHPHSTLVALALTNSQKIGEESPKAPQKRATPHHQEPNQLTLDARYHSARQIRRKNGQTARKGPTPEIIHPTLTKMALSNHGSRIPRLQ